MRQALSRPCQVPRRLLSQPPRPRQSHQERWGHVDKGPLGVHDADGLQPMPLPNLIVILVVCRGDLHRAWGVRRGARVTRDSEESLPTRTPPFADGCGSQITPVPHPPHTVP